MSSQNLKKICLAVAAIPLSMFPGNPQAQSLSIVVTASEDLNFGAFIANAGGNVTVNTVGGRSSSGSVTLVGANGLEREAVLAITGSPSFPIDVSMTAASFNVNNGGGGTMTVDNFDLGAGAGNPVSVSITGTSVTVPVGGRLVVGGAQASGTYTGIFSVNANYQ